MSQKLYTIGHSNLALEEFINLLQKYSITAVADVRSHPYSRYLPHFNQAPLKKALHDIGISYVFLGGELGARPKDLSCYVNGKALYQNIATTELFTEGIQRLVKGSQNYTIAMVCAEKDPLTCHRAILVCRRLKGFGLDIFHILPDRSLESHQHLEERLLDLYKLNSSLETRNTEPRQLSLFDNFLEETKLDLQLKSKEDCLEEAYLRQGNKIAYVDKKNEQIN